MLAQRGYDVYGVKKTINRHVIRALRRLQSLAEPDDAPGIPLSEIINEVLYTTRNLVPVRSPRMSVYRSLVNFDINGVVNKIAMDRFSLVDDDGAALLCGIPTLAEKARRDQERRKKKALLEASGAGSKRRRKRRLYFTSPYKLRKLRKRRAAAKMRSDGNPQDALTTYDGQATAVEPVAEEVAAHEIDGDHQNLAGTMGPDLALSEPLTSEEHNSEQVIRDMRNTEQVPHMEPVPLARPKRRRKRRAFFTSPYKLRKQRERRAAAKMRADGITRDAFTSNVDQAAAVESVAEVAAENEHDDNSLVFATNGTNQNLAGTMGPDVALLEPLISEDLNTEQVTARNMQNTEQVAELEPVPLARPKRRRKRRAFFTSPYKLRKQRERRAAAKMRADGITPDTINTHNDQATAAEPAAEVVTANQSDDSFSVSAANGENQNSTDTLGPDRPVLSDASLIAKEQNTEQVTHGAMHNNEQGAHREPPLFFGKTLRTRIASDVENAGNRVEAASTDNTAHASNPRHGKIAPDGGVPEIIVNLTVRIGAPDADVSNTDETGPDAHDDNAP